MKKAIFMFLFSLTVSAHTEFIICNGNNSKVNINTKFPRYEMSVTGMAYHSYTRLKEEQFGCFYGDVCFESEDANKRFKLEVRDTNSTFFNAKLNIRDKRTNMEEVIFLSCSKSW